MKKCVKCDKEFPNEAKFCYLCGTELSNILIGIIENNVENLDAQMQPIHVKRDILNNIDNSSSFVVNGFEMQKLSSEEERQSLLDITNSKLKGERTLWLIGAIVSLFIYVSILFGFVTSIAYFAFYDIYSYDTDLYEDEIEAESSDMEVIIVLLGMGVSIGFYIFIPCAVARFILASKSKKCIKTLYSDCGYTYRRCRSAVVIILPILFNPFVLIFSIPLYKLARNNFRVYLETSDIQCNYFYSNTK